MKISNYISSTIFLSLMTLVISAFFIPMFAKAADTPSCVLLVSTSAGIYAKSGESEVMQVIGDPLKIFWLSSSVDRAENKSGSPIPIFGQTIKNPKSLTNYSYTFIKGSNETKCSVAVHPVTGEFNDNSLTTEKNQPIITGEASKVKEVKVEVYKISTKSLVHESEGIKVVDGKWRYEIDEKLADGQYDIVLKANEDWQLNKIDSGILTIGDVSDSNLPGTVVVQSIPLLTGGSARAGETKSLLYLHMLNVSNDPVTITGISMKQVGSASTDSILSLSATDDTNKAQGKVGSSTVSPFKSGVAKIPITLTLAPKETRLFTLKGTIANNISSDLGDSLRLEVSGVSSRSNVKGDFPIRGVTWILSN
jgi:hypothetical protein